MRSTEQRTGHRSSRNFENELSLRYLSPGAFTVLSPHEYGSSPDPPSAPEPYRLTPNSRRRKAQAFSIIAEASSNPGSRSPSPTGRVSPFRGRGFNPIGSRHASPIPSPPPSESRTSSGTSRINQSPKKSQIPQLSRRHSGAFQTGKVTSTVVPKYQQKNGAKLSPHLSKSLTNLSPKNVSHRPPSNPQNLHKRYTKKPAFERLSPITGSSPEYGTNGNNKSQSSPSKIPRSTKSQPASRKSSPTRSPFPANNSSRQNSRPGSKNASQHASRDSSPSKSQTRIPIKNSYRDISAKVNTFNKSSKPKVPQTSQDSKSVADKSKGGKGMLSRRQSINKIQSEKIDEPSTSNAYSSSNASSTRESSKKVQEDNNDNNINDKSVYDKKKESGDKSKPRDNYSGSNDDITMVEDDVEAENHEIIHKSASNSKLTDLPTATTVVSSTTATAAQPLKLDTNIEDILKEELNKQTYSSDGRVLSATSVSSAMNKMNDTVLNSQTLLKEHSFAKLSPAASAIIAMSNENHRGNKALDTKSATTALPTIESIHKKLDDIGQNINNSFSDSNKVYMESIESTVKNNINKTLTPDHNSFSGSYIQKSANEKLREARTMVASDVKPIKILVKEKPSEIEVQSGNIRLPSNVTNGLSGTPSLPPPQNQENDSHSNQEQQHTVKPTMNCCSKLLARCKCKRNESGPEKTREESDEQPGCFNCRRKLRENQTNADKLDESEKRNKKRIWDRLKCCRSKKIGDSSCCPRQRKDSWVTKSNTTSTKSISCKDKCKHFFRQVFCCLCCRKKKVEEDHVSRRESVMSKKKSLTPTSVPPVDTKPKIDMSLVEHSSLMKGAIPILPVALAWICLVFNVFLPGTGTALSGMFCLCLGKPRFSQNDGPRPRIGAFLIDLIIGCGQLFTVLFCLVGWGWSIWWGVIMLKIARKHKRIRLVEERALAQVPVVNENHHSRDPERGS